MAGKCLSEFPNCSIEISNSIYKKLIESALKGFDIGMTGTIGKNCERSRSIQILQGLNQDLIIKKLNDAISTQQINDISEEYVRYTISLIKSESSLLDMVYDHEKTYLQKSSENLNENDFSGYLDMPKEWEIIEDYFPDEFEIYERSIYREHELWRYADSMSYPDFYRVWHNFISPISTESSKNI